MEGLLEWVIGWSQSPSGSVALFVIAFAESSFFPIPPDILLITMALIDPDAKPGEFRRPGHVFPLIAKPGGVLRRAGHTEAAVDLARMCGSTPAAVICEVIKEDGTMARLPS